jgi:5,5'-dehydrodivanillate O-demethylase oxygenase subunit
MLTAEQNRRLTEVGPGTPMGNLLRRYWMPISGVSEFETITVKPVRLFGEDLVLYKDLSGTFGLVDRHCPHRRADLSYGFVENCGIRCNYHGWRYDETGRCVEQPFDDTANPEARFRDKVRITSYPVQALGGILWAYMGPQPAPVLPNWEPFQWQNGFVEIYWSKIPCNWLQCQENSIDPVHFEWMHRNWTVRLKGQTGPYGNTHVKLDFKEFEYGFTYHRLIEGMPEDHERWLVGRIALWPNCLGPLFHFEWRVPIDDENTLSIHWHFTRVPKGREPYVQGSIPTWEGPIVDPLTGRMITSHVTNQDFVAWVGQGTIADRTKEMLSPSDRGIILMRKRFFDDMERVERGEDPSGILRDPELRDRIELPIMNRHMFVEGTTLQEMLADPALDPRREFRTQYGQPAYVRAAFLEAMGFDPNGMPIEEGGTDFLVSAGETARRGRLAWS